MKKKTKILIAVVILATIIAIVISFMQIGKYDTHIATIIELEDGICTVSTQVEKEKWYTREVMDTVYDFNGNSKSIDEVKVGDVVYCKSTATVDEVKMEKVTIMDISEDYIRVSYQTTGLCNFSTEKAVVKDSNGKKIKDSNLEIGDTIYIVNKKPEAIPDFEYEVEPIDNVRLVKRLNTDIENNDNHVIIKEFTKNGISLKIENAEELKVSDKSSYKIYKKVIDERQYTIPQKTNIPGIAMAENDISDSSKIQIKKVEVIRELKTISGFPMSEGSKLDENGNITYNWNLRYGELEKGEYEFIQYNEGDNLKVNIKIKFTIDDEGNLIYKDPTITKYDTNA